MVLNEENVELLKGAIYETAVDDYKRYCSILNKIISKRYKKPDDFLKMDSYKYQIKQIDKFLVSGEYQFDIEWGQYAKESLHKLLKEERPKVYKYLYGG